MASPSSHIITAEEVATQLIQEMMDSGKWDDLGIRLGSTLEFNGTADQAEETVRQLLERKQFKLTMKDEKTTEYDLARQVEKADGTASYRKALQKLLKEDSEIGDELRKDIAKRVENIVYGDPGPNEHNT